MWYNNIDDIKKARNTLDSLKFDYNHELEAYLHEKSVDIYIGKNKICDLFDSIDNPGTTFLRREYDA